MKIFVFFVLNTSNKRITFHVMKILAFLDLVSILIKKKNKRIAFYVMKICLFVRNNTKNTFHVMKKKFFFFQIVDLVRILINVPKNKCKRKKRIKFHVIKFFFFFKIKNLIIVIFIKKNMYNKI